MKRKAPPQGRGFHSINQNALAILVLLIALTRAILLLLLAGLSAVCFDFGPASPLRHLGTSPRLLVTGLLFAGAGSLIAISPLGRRSGAHLNPVVTLAFWTQGKVHVHDVAGYILSQLVGAVLGTAAVALLWRSQATAIHIVFATTQII